MLSGESETMKSRNGGIATMSRRMMAALMRLNRRLRMAVRFPLRFVVSEARIFGVTEPMAAPMMR